MGPGGHVRLIVCADLLPHSRPGERAARSARRVVCVVRLSHPGQPVVAGKDPEAGS